MERVAHTLHTETPLRERAVDAIGPVPHSHPMLTNRTHPRPPQIASSTATARSSSSSTPAKSINVRAGLVTGIGPTIRRSTAATAPRWTTTSADLNLRSGGTHSSGCCTRTPSNPNSDPAAAYAPSASLPAHNTAASANCPADCGNNASRRNW